MTVCTYSFQQPHFPKPICREAQNRLRTSRKQSGLLKRAYRLHRLKQIIALSVRTQPQRKLDSRKRVLPLNAQMLFAWL
ncbi:hypothetical protein HMPREF9141_2683 [Prevotella multiformis DSM 16608]|uniref:Uncharacterized protein n=1 Tax=Prevotella multiformis DSM 16608 TaxID=888743 RepID=F0FAR6_9BACT|nr:hypothetical protein HMPREF9141_2683 [Prevotella multiformis DSM 16608]